MRNNSAENTSPVTSHEGNHKLEVLGVRITGGGENVSVEVTDGLLESNELNDGVWDLSAPKGLDTLVHTSPSLVVHNLGPCLTEGLGESTSIRSLHSNLGLKSNDLLIFLSCGIDADWTLQSARG